MSQYLKCRINMARTGIDFFTVQIGSYLLFDMQIKGRCDNEQIAQGDFWYY